MVQKELYIFDHIWEFLILSEDSKVINVLLLGQDLLLIRNGGVGVGDRRLSMTKPAPVEAGCTCWGRG